MQVDSDLKAFANEAGLSGTLPISVMLMWVIVPLMATLLVFQRREL